MELGVAEFLFGFVAVILALYYFATSSYDYWERIGVQGPRPAPLFGNFADAILAKLSITEVYAKLYEEWKSQRFVGIYNARKPELLVTDLDLAKSILIKDFHVFNGRGPIPNGKTDPLSDHLFAIAGPQWKYLRSRLSPIFTSGKLRHMFDLMLECAEHFETHLRKNVEREKIVECREVSAKFTTDVIGSCAFGINMNALGDEDSEFRKYGREIFTTTYFRFFQGVLRQIVPKIVEVLRIHTFPPEVSNFFISSMKDTMEFRERENVVRNDLVALLMDIKKNHDDADFEITDSLLTAQAFVFFGAGFETSSTTISFALLELAHRPEIQEKLRDEIVNSLKRHNEAITYDTVKEMTYLEMVVQETLRKNPPVTVLLRQASEPYAIPGTNITLPKGTTITIPIYGIQNDPKHFPDPEVFDPERFTERVKRSRHSMAHLPFGDGPKNCIGARFAAFQTKLGLIKVLKNFRVKPTKNSPLPYKISKSPILAPVNGVPLEFENVYVSSF